MSGRRLTFDEALARLNALLEDIDPGAIEAMHQRMLNIWLEAHPWGDKTCGTCGAPATMAARHVLERWDPTAADQQFEPGKTRYGCDEHPVESAIVRVTDAEIRRTIARGLGIPRDVLEDSEP